jgi:tripartite-type tricarboxylate transporter receptor subunit TctC
MKARLLLALAGAFALPATALAQNSVADFYKSHHTINLLVGSGAGGGYDAYARLLARHMSKHIPGHPNIVVQNKPGAGSLVVTNYLYNAAPKDGTVFGQIQREVPFMPIFGVKGPQFTIEKFNWLGSLASETTLCVSWITSPVKTFADVQKHELIIGGSGPNDTEIVPAMLDNLLGAKFKIITGYPSSTAVTLAVERGEVHGICASYSSLAARNAHWFRDKKVHLLIQSALKKDPKLPNVPLAGDLIKNPDDKRLLELNDARLAVGRPFVIPPGVPADRVKALRKAFDETAKDPEFLADAQAQKRDVDLVTGEEMQALLEKISKTPKSLVDRLADVQKYKGPKVTAKVEVPKHEGKVGAVEKGGRSIVIKLSDGKDFKAKISGSRTKVTIGGKKADRGAIKVGATCTVSSFKSGQEASAVACK